MKPDYKFPEKIREDLCERAVLAARALDSLYFVIRKICEYYPALPSPHTLEEYICNMGKANAVSDSANLVEPPADVEGKQRLGGEARKRPTASTRLPVKSMTSTTVARTPNNASSIASSWANLWRSALTAVKAIAGFTRQREEAGE